MIYAQLVNKPQIFRVWHKGTVDHSVELYMGLVTEGRLSLCDRRLDSKQVDKDGYPMPYYYPISDSLKIKLACCCFGLLPADLFADAMQEELPETEWAAEQLREFARVGRETGFPYN